MHAAVSRPGDGMGREANSSSTFWVVQLWASPTAAASPDRSRGGRLVVDDNSDAADSSGIATMLGAVVSVAYSGRAPWMRSKTPAGFVCSKSG